jgi:hypothetical protein
MAFAAERLAQEARHPIDRRARLVVVRWVAALAAVSGLAVALFFGVGPIRITVHDRVAVTQATGAEGTGLTVTDQTRAETRRVTCVPYLRYDGSANQDGACAARVRGPLRVAGVGLLGFLAGSALWLISGGDRALGLSGRRAFILSRLP